MERDTVVKEVVEALKIFSRDIRTQIDEMGSQLRAEIQDTANQLRAEIQETANQLRAEMQETANQLRAEMQETANQLRAEMQETANQLRAEMQQFRAEVNERFDRLEQKFAGLRVELTETQETVHFLASKTIQHEKKLHHLAKQLESIR
ncbi:gp58-like family protein [Geobacillus stearothermophilus]|nr:gp58-like family protein [Geobacillus stearothermophilus]WJQ04492.1 gp58-like family protein [Geobacillus stearothermophilus]